MLVPNGMPRFEELSETERENLRQYLRTQADVLRKKDQKVVATPGG
jgi:quinohemoprotein ethanol dehydrogenase